MSLPVRVDAYRGYQNELCPCAFTADDEILQIHKIEDRWYEPEAMFLRVRTADGRRFILRYEEDSGAWTLRDGFDGTALLGRPEIRVIPVDENGIARALREVEYCESCHSAEAGIPFDWLLQDATDAGEMTDFLMLAPARCPNCRQPVTEQTLVSLHDLQS